jgi:peptidoglycan hydrolase-like protein with peptidoglycan-binding domain
MRRRRLVTVVVGVAVVGVAVAAVGGDWFGDDDAEDAAAASTATGVATVERRTLEQTEDVTGTLDYGDAHGLAAGRVGTLTSVAAAGTVVERGQPLLSVDRQPLVLLVGTVPLYRDLTVGVDDGPDVRQLEDNLTALGYTAGGTLVVDEHFGTSTTTAVEDWQEALGVEATGTVTRAGAVFLPGAVRIADVTGEVGATVEPSGEALTYTATTHLVGAQLEVSDAHVGQVGDTVGVVLPDGTEVGGTVLAVAEAASSSGTSSGSTAGSSSATTATATTTPMLDVIVALDDVQVASGYTTASVEVRFTADRAEDVLAVPVTALMALLESGYAVELAGSGASPGELVPVEVGMIADGWVEVSGDDLAEGVEVVVPA